MQSLLFWIFVSLISFNLAANDRIAQKAEFLCSVLLNGQAFQYDKHFNQDFIAAIPEQYFFALVHDAIGALGPCVRATPADASDGTIGLYRFFAEDGDSVLVHFSLDDHGLIEGLLFKDFVLDTVEVKSLLDATKIINEWHGHASLSIMPFAGAHYDVRGDELQPLASGFKLYVLAALADAIATNRLDWNQGFAISKAHRSLPSGIMHTFPEGQVFSLYDFAEYMIKISDNTATDHLLDIVGRDNVVEIIINLNNQFISKNIPFINTAEMFKLKWAAPPMLAQAFINGDELSRRTILANLESVSLQAVGTNGVSITSPTLIRDIEWFGSTNDLCQAMRALKEKNSPFVMKALSQNTPLVKTGVNAPWKYAGFKGGFEPGVITGTFLLEDQKGNFTCVSMAWHDEKETVNNFIFFDLVKKVIEVIER